MQEKMFREGCTMYVTMAVCVSVHCTCLLSTEPLAGDTSCNRIKTCSLPQVSTNCKLKMFCWCMVGSVIHNLLRELSVRKSSTAVLE